MLTNNPSFSGNRLKFSSGSLGQWQKQDCHAPSGLAFLARIKVRLNVLNSISRRQAPVQKIILLFPVDTTPKERRDVHLREPEVV